MHVPATPTSVAHDHKTLLQVEAYLMHNLDIATQLVDNTRSRLTSIETQLATPAAASGKAKKTLRNTRAKLAKQLRKCRTEVEMLTRAIDEVKTKIAATDVISGRRLSVLATGNGNVVSSSLDGMSQRSSSISSYISSGELSYGQAFTYEQPVLFSPVAGALPYIHTNVPIAFSSHNLASAPVWPITPYGMASPYSSGWPIYSNYSMASPEVQHPALAYGYYPYGPAEFYGSNPDSAQFNPAPLSMPLEPTTWGFQQSPTSDVHTIDAPQKTAKRHSIAVMDALSDTAAVLGKDRGHKRGASATIEEIVREWDMGS